MKTWYLGIHRPNWLADPRLTDVPVFISRRTFLNRNGVAEYMVRMPRAVGRYAIDSGGFTELQKYGRWTITPKQYVAFLRRCWAEIGPFDFAAPMDYMCEPAVIEGGTFARQHFAGTGLSVEEHLRLTVDNGIELHRLAPELPIMYVLQGWKKRHYQYCWDMYEAAGVDLTAQPVIGVGSICRRQHMDEAADIIASLYDRGLRNIHGFGFKIQGVRACRPWLATADSLAGSLDGRYAGPCRHPAEWGRPGQQPQHEGNCIEYFLAWRQRHVINSQPSTPTRQVALFDMEAA